MKWGKQMILVRVIPLPSLLHKKGIFHTPLYIYIYIYLYHLSKDLYVLCSSNFILLLSRGLKKLKGYSLIWHIRTDTFYIQSFRNDE